MAAPWYDDAWTNRAPLTLDISVGQATSADAIIVIPPTLSEFWDNVLGPWNDVVLTLSDGVTPFSMAHVAGWGLSGTFNATTRVGSILIDNLNNSFYNDNEVNCFWMYWGNAAGTGYGVGSPTPSPNVSGYLAEVAVGPQTQPIIKTQRASYGSLYPAVQLQKAAGETAFVYWDFRAELYSLSDVYNGRSYLEGIQSVVASDENGGSAWSVHTASSPQFMGDQGGVVRTSITGGTDGDVGVIILTAKTTLGRTLVRYAELQIRDLVESQ